METPVLEGVSTQLSSIILGILEQYEKHFRHWNKEPRVSMTNSGYKDTIYEGGLKIFRCSLQQDVLGFVHC